MRPRKLPIILLAAGILASCSTAVDKKTEEPAKAVNFSKVAVRDSFWLPRIDRLAEITLPACLNQCENETQRVKNFAIAAGLEEGTFQGLFYDDSDLYKMIEGCAYSLMKCTAEAILSKPALHITMPPANAHSSIPERASPTI